MQRRKLGMAVVWMVCLLGMVAVVWSRPPMGSSRGTSHPPLALVANQEPRPVSETSHPSPEPQLPTLTGSSKLMGQPPAPAVPVAQTEEPLPPQEWTREFKPFKLTLKFEGNRLWATFQGQLDDGKEFECQFAADYHLTKDSLLYGIITSGETAITAKKLDELMEADALAKRFFDQPFSFRYRLDEDVLTIKDFNIGHLDKDDDELLETLRKMIIGSFRLLPAAK